jgi:hypothetical protein
MAHLPIIEQNGFVAEVDVVVPKVTVDQRLQVSIPMLQFGRLRHFLFEPLTRLILTRYGLKHYERSVNYFNNSSSLQSTKV